MGYKLIILLGLLLGVLNCIHILVKDYQAVTAPKLLRLLFKRDINSHEYNRPSVRWKKILMYDRVQCARRLYCSLGAQTTDEKIRNGFILMLSLEPHLEDRSSLDVFKTAFTFGKNYKKEATCELEYPLCPFDGPVLFDLVKHLLDNY